MCNCAKSDTNRDNVPAKEGRAVLTVLHERAAMCQFCHHAEHGPSFFRDGAVRCNLTGRGVLEHMTSLACPEGRHPGDGYGITKWLGVRWYGVPYPFRVALWAFGRSHRRPGEWRGCGCVVWLKSVLAASI